MNVHGLIHLGIGLLGVILFAGGVFFPISISIAVLIYCCAYLVGRFRKQRIGLLVLLLWCVFALPFIHLLPYLWFDFESRSPAKMWGLATVPYMVEPAIVSLTAMIGAIGGVGVCFGVALSRTPISHDQRFGNANSPRRFKTLPTLVWLFWVLIGLVFSWIVAPQDSLFTARYTTSSSAVSAASFGSAWMISYVILTFAFCDSLLEQQWAVRRFKQIAFFLVAGFIVIFFQFLRGDRAAVPWVFALALIYFYWAAGFTQRLNFQIPWIRVGLWASLLVILSMFVGALRQSLVGVSDFSAFLRVLEDQSAANRIGVENLLTGTWSAVLLTPLSVAGDYVNHLLEFKYGRDYVDLLLSTPPGFIADAIGYSRPIDAFHGPAWEMRYGLGGTHATVVPFMNFGMVGVFFICGLWSYAITRYEKRASKRISISNLALLGTIATMSAHWLWYGEKNAINSLIIWAAAMFCYRVAISIFVRVR